MIADYLHGTAVLGHVGRTDYGWHTADDRRVIIPQASVYPIVDDEIERIIGSDFGLPGRPLQVPEGMTVGKPIVVGHGTHHGYSGWAGNFWPGYYNPYPDIETEEALVEAVRENTDLQRKLDEERRKRVVGEIASHPAPFWETSWPDPYRSFDESFDDAMVRGTGMMRGGR